jgi:diacylglycerol kinase family enzyme
MPLSLSTQTKVITGLLTRPDDVVDKVFVGIVPSGTANAMANELDGYRAKSHVR